MADVLGEKQKIFTAESAEFAEKDGSSSNPSLSASSYNPNHLSPQFTVVDTAVERIDSPSPR